MIDFDACSSEYLQALRDGDEGRARGVVERARQVGAAPYDLYFRVFAPSMVMIGVLWERNEVNVAEEHLATAITERMISYVSPMFGAAQLSSRRTVVLGCVEGERHVLGLRMLSDLFREHGWRSLYLGADVPAADFVAMARQANADVVGLSVGLEHNMLPMRALVVDLRAALPQAIVLAGGAVFDRSPDLWQTLGVDVYHPDPARAVELAIARAEARSPGSLGNAAVERHS